MEWQSIVISGLRRAGAAMGTGNFMAQAQPMKSSTCQ